MLIRNLGQTRTTLLKSFKGLTDDQINQKPKEGHWSISQVLIHLSENEKETAELILNSLKMDSKKVEERDLSYLMDRSMKVKSSNEPSEDYYTVSEVIRRLEESRFQYLQAILNETHVETLKEKSVNHSLFGRISLKNLVDFIWLHEQRHIEQINEIINAIN